MLPHYLLVSPPTILALLLILFRVTVYNPHLLLHISTPLITILCQGVPAICQTIQLQISMHTHTHTLKTVCALGVADTVMRGVQGNCCGYLACTGLCLLISCRMSELSPVLLTGMLKPGSPEAFLMWRSATLLLSLHTNNLAPYYSETTCKLTFTVIIHTYCEVA